MRRADIILPNVTEACFLTGTEYVKDYDGLFVCELEEKLKKLTDAKIIITGVEFGGNIGEFIGGNKRGQNFLFFTYVMIYFLIPFFNTLSNCTP